jgi:hypothetical protein
MDPLRSSTLRVAVSIATLLLTACSLDSFGTRESESGQGGRAGTSASSASGTMSVSSSRAAASSANASSVGSGGSGGVGSASSSSSAGGGEMTDGGAPPPLGAASSFAVLGGSTVTNMGPTTTIIGDLGVTPGTSITGIPLGMPVGTNHKSDAISAQAQLDATTAFNALMAAPCDVTLPTAELGGRTLVPGV